MARLASLPFRPRAGQPSLPPEPALPQRSPPLMPGPSAGGRWENGMYYVLQVANTGKLMREGRRNTI